MWHIHTHNVNMANLWRIIPSETRVGVLASCSHAGNNKAVRKFKQNRMDTVYWKRDKFSLVGTHRPPTQRDFIVQSQRIAWLSLPADEPPPPGGGLFISLWPVAIFSSHFKSAGLRGGKKLPTATVNGPMTMNWPRYVQLWEGRFSLWPQTQALSRCIHHRCKIKRVRR